MLVALLLAAWPQALIQDGGARGRRFKQVSVQDMLAVEEMCVRRLIAKTKPSSTYTLFSSGFDDDRVDPRLVSRLADLKKRFISYTASYRTGKQPPNLPNLTVGIEDRIDATHLIARYETYNLAEGGAVLVEKRKGKWTFLKSQFPKATSEAIRMQALAHLLKTYCVPPRRRACYIGVEETPPFFAMWFGRGKDPLASWISRGANLGFRVFPSSKTPTTFVKGGFDTLVLSQVQRIDDRRGMLRFQTGGVYGRDPMDLPGYGEDYAFLLATRSGKGWKFNAYGWDHQPSE